MAPDRQSHEFYSITITSLLASTYIFFSIWFNFCLMAHQLSNYAIPKPSFVRYFCCAKSEGVTDRNTIARWLKKFHSDCKEFSTIQKKRSGRSKTVFQAIEANLSSSIRKLSGWVGISQFCVVRHLCYFGKKMQICLNCASHYQNITGSVLVV